MLKFDFSIKIVDFFGRIRIYFMFSIEWGVSPIQH